MRPKSPCGSGAASFAPNPLSAAYRVCCIDNPALAGLLGRSGLKKVHWTFFAGFARRPSPLNESKLRKPAVLPDQPSPLSDANQGACCYFSLKNRHLSKNLHKPSFFLLRVLDCGPRYRLTEDETLQRCGFWFWSCWRRRRIKFWIHEGRYAQGLGVTVYFVSLLFEMFGN